MSLGFDARVLVVVLAAYAVASTALALLVAGLWCKLLSPANACSPRAIGRRLLVLRAMPAVLGTGTAGIVGVAFARFEPALEREAVGAPMVALAALGAGLWMMASARALRTACASASLARRWRGGSPLRIEGCPIEVRQLETPFPVVALAGCLRPRLVVASRVAGACPPGELAAMVAHELAHLSARDNLCRALFSICPDVLAWLSVSGAMERAWHEATEQAADEEATGADGPRRLALASALVRVARLASAAATPPLVASALFRGEPIADRVRRLLAPPAPPAARRPSVPRLVTVLILGSLTAGATTVAAWALSQPHLFEIVETAIRFGR